MPEKAQEADIRLSFQRLEAPGHEHWGRNYE